MLDNSVTKWNSLISMNEKIFSENVKNLNVYERGLIESLEQIKKVETTSKQIKETYLDNYKSLDEIGNEQS